MLLDKCRVRQFFRQKLLFVSFLFIYISLCLGRTRFYIRKNSDSFEITKWRRKNTGTILYPSSLCDLHGVPFLCFYWSAKNGPGWPSGSVFPIGVSLTWWLFAQVILVWVINKRNLWKTMCIYFHYHAIKGDKKN